jgi:hypothetical protein
MRHLTILLAAGLLSACATSFAPGQSDSRFGFDTRLTLAQQVLHADAGRNRDPVAGMDGRSARSAYERYQKASGEQPPSIINGGAK